MRQAAKQDGGRTGIFALAEAMRPRHWVKNAFVAAPLLFARRFDDPLAWGQSMAAVAAFCLLSSGVYLINDVCDRRADRAHPVKSHRPVASGRLSVASAVMAAVVLLAAGLGISVAVELTADGASRPMAGYGLLVWTGGYLLMNLAYSLWLKDHAVVDVIIVAMGFVFRAMAGAAAIAVPISPWLVLCTFTLCLFIALCKRRSEISEFPGGRAEAVRTANRAYASADLEHMLTVSTALAILTYSLYCVAPRTVAQVGSAHMIWTVPLVVYGLFRYGRLARRAGGGDPIELLVRDKVMWLVVAAYVVLAGLILTYGSRPGLRDILDVRTPAG
ncbi:MAG: decaprenyl-phosphate phosphoribosyltransferase [Phycisphaerae bacterium]